MLAARSGEVVSREEIRETLWGSDTFVDFEQGVNHCIRSIRAVLETAPRSGVYIETVPRRGYRLVTEMEPAAPASPFAETARLPVLHLDPEPEPARRSWLSWPAIVEKLRAFLAWPKRPSAEGGAVRLAIMPFDSLAGEPDRGSVSGMLSEQISTHLSRASGERLHLVPSCSAKALKQKPNPVAAAREMGVQYILGGSVWWSAERVRVNAHLVRVRDEKQLWTESYDRVLRDVFEFHNEMARTIAEEARARLL